MNFRCLALVALTVVGGVRGGHAHAQTGKQITTQDQFWVAYINTLKFSERWSLGTDIQERRSIDPDAQFLFAVRAHVMRTLGRSWDVRAGGSYFLQWSNDPRSSSDLIVPEWRPHVELNNTTTIGRLRLDHRYRGEARFIPEVTDGQLAGGHIFTNFRLRYQLGLEFPLVRVKRDEKRIERMYLRIADEVMLNAGSKVVLNTFDQNRVLIGIGYKPTPALTIILSYLDLVQQRPTGNFYFHRHNIRLTVVHKLDLSRKEPVKGAP